MIDLRRLRAFVVLAEEGHVTRAAERLGIQQPPLTRLLQGLEAELGVLLMHRMPRGVRPTEAGKVLLDEAKIILERANGVADMVHRAARGEQGRLAIGFTSSAALHPFVPKALRAFHESLPKLSVVLEEAGRADRKQRDDERRRKAMQEAQPRKADRRFVDPEVETVLHGARI